MFDSIRGFISYGTCWTIAHQYDSVIFYETIFIWWSDRYVYQIFFEKKREFDLKNVISSLRTHIHTDSVGSVFWIIFFFCIWLVWCGARMGEKLCYPLSSRLLVFFFLPCIHIHIQLMLTTAKYFNFKFKPI